ncbi:MAG: PROBABLE CONSERVED TRANSMEMBRANE PROTEIN [uncultured Solirubrobacteraceae bacterium]|uniref:PROBABLE CONSERVED TRANSMEMBRANE PROTEIN n=1 Tax=uncultured Solirubrobacteraceae bacterium TaxID=1162706 RepID=A0A6J4SEK0_9ACTN|nr:MAG: PROBABLE CONSERVED TRANSMEMBRANE PROTEIN [uncultured Solirubrobacteraceae bacterium]
MAARDSSIPADDQSGRHGLARLFPAEPPPGPFRRAFFSSPLRGPWLTAVLGTLLLAGVVVVAATGFLSHAAYNPSLGANAIVDPGRDLPLTFDWPTSPSWLYALTQGLHVTIGVATVPLVLAKLWSVIPRLFAWPPVSSPAQAIERLAVALLVSSSVFLFATGIANMQYWYPFGFNFVVAHYWAAVMFVAALAVHLVAKVPVAARAYRTHGVLRPLREDLAGTRPESEDPDGLVPEDPAEPTVTRRGALAFVGAGSLLLVVTTAGQAIGGPARSLAVLAPRRQVTDDGPNGFPVNKTFRGAGVEPGDVKAGVYRLTLRGPAGERTLSREDLLALPQRSASLPIACVEGWSTTQKWTGVPIAALADMVGAAEADEALVESLQPRGVLRQATLSQDQFREPRSLLALKVNGEDLSLDHGFPARIIVPALPGVHNTKWVASIDFGPHA